jgi:broad specificity phosphatase PhoE
MKFTFLRHGESETNLLGICAGSGTDSPLTIAGIEHAERLASCFSPQHDVFDVVVHTGLKRSIETAQIINQKIQAPLVKLDDLKEHYVGDWEGQPWNSVAQKWLSYTNPPNGETWKDFANRIEKGLSYLIENYESPLVVSHGGVFRALNRINMDSHLPENLAIYNFVRDTAGLWSNSAYKFQTNNQSRIVLKK